jgi:Glycerophosphoryl diester phosphodiesterase family
MRNPLRILSLAALLFYTARCPSQVVPLPRAHAHNDYEHQRPLADALEHGFCSIEADVWLVDGRLLVAHDLKDARPERTLQRLYLDPLQQRVKENGGRVFRNGPTVILLVDAKSEATNTYAALKLALQPYRSMLTVYRSGRTQTNAVSVIISGNRAREFMAAEGERLAAYDGRLADLDTDAPVHFIPLVSDNWRQHFGWKGTAEEGGMNAQDRRKLQSILQRAHARGQRVRFWGMPDTPRVWQAMREAEVDLINTDDLEGLSRFLRADAVP